MMIYIHIVKEFPSLSKLTHLPPHILHFFITLKFYFIKKFQLYNTVL